MRPLTGELITLREPKPSDAPKIAGFAKDPDIARYARIPDSYGLEDAEAFGSLSWEGFRRRRSEQYAITREGGLIGMIGLTNLDHDDGTAEVGFWIGARYRRRGYTGEALDLVIDRAFDDLSLDRIAAETSTSNTASRRLLEGRGFVHEGTVGHVVLEPGLTHELAFYVRR